MTAPGPRARFVTVATAVALHRGGMTLCGPLVADLDEALAALPRPAGSDPVAELVAPSRALIQARLMSDEHAFGQAKYGLHGALAAYWVGKAHEAMRQGA